MKVSELLEVKGESHDQVIKRMVFTALDHANDNGYEPDGTPKDVAVELQRMDSDLESIPVNDMIAFVKQWLKRHTLEGLKRHSVKEAHFDDSEFDMQTHDDDDEIMKWCKKNNVKVEKKGAKNLVRFSGSKEALRDMIHQFWGQPADYTAAIREGAMKNLLTDFEEHYLDNDGSSWSEEKLSDEVHTFLKKKGLPADLHDSLVKAAKTLGAK